MPLIQGKSPKSFEKNLKTEMHSGKPKDQSLAIAYSIQRKAKKKKMARGGEVEEITIEKTAHPEHYKDEYAAADYDMEKMEKSPRLPYYDPKRMAQGGMIEMAAHPKDVYANDRMADDKPMEELERTKIYKYGNPLMKAKGGMIEHESTAEINRYGHPSDVYADDEMAKDYPMEALERAKQYKYGPSNNFASGGLMEEIHPHDYKDTEAGDDYDMERLENSPRLPYYDPMKMAQGGMAMNPKLQQAYMDMHDDGSVADRIMAKHKKKKMYEGGMYADGGQVDLAYNAEESPNMEDQFSYNALKKENYSESDALHDLTTPLDSGDHSVDLKDEDEYDMVDKIRQKLRMRGRS